MTSQTITALGNAIINLINRRTPIATASTVGMVKPDGSTINIDANGVISSNGGSSSLEVCDIGMALYVDETKGLRRYLNGQIVDINTNTQAFLTRLKSITALHPSLLDTEENWQAAKARSPFGQVGRFVFNYNGDNIVSVRLPRVVNVQGLFDLQNLGMTVGQALPSHTHTRGDMNITGALSASNIWAGTAGASGCFSVADNGYHNSGGNGGSGCNTYTWFYNASNSWTGSTSAPNYLGTVATGAVQQEAIQYPYFIQIATGQETENNITNEIELNTPSFFGDSKYVPTKVNNLSQLKSEGQNNPKGTYPSYYDWILENVNKGEKGFKLSTATDITDYDFVINTTDETFRLPLLNGSEDLPTGEIINQPIPSTGNSYYDIGYNCFVTIAFENCTHCRLWDNTQDRENWTQTVDVVGYRGKTLFMPKGHQLGLFYENGTMLKFTYQKAKGNGSLYYYVGETVQNANLIDAGRIGEILPTKTDMQQAAKASMPSSRYIDLTLGASGLTYKAPANGFITLRYNTNATFCYCHLYNKSTHFGTTKFYSLSGLNGMLQNLEVQGGSTFQIDYSGLDFSLFRFIYAEGSK